MQTQIIPQGWTHFSLSKVPISQFCSYIEQINSIQFFSGCDADQTYL